MAPPLKESVSVVVPVYGGAQTIAELAERVGKVLDGEGREWELVLVNDSSPDDSWEIIRRLSAEEPRVRGVDLMRNFGQHNALLAGIVDARNELIVTMDDDLQHPPEEIPLLLDELGKGHDAVYGEPQRERHAWWRGFASRMTKAALQKAMGADSATMINSFRAFRAELRPGFSDYHGPFVSVDALLTWSTRDFATVSYRHEARKAGESTYNLFNLTGHALTLITAFSTRPLRIASLVGFGSVFLGLAALAYVLAGLFLSGRDVPGFVFLASLVSILAGAQLFALGVIGEYLARMHMRSMGKPPYTVRGRTDG
jgi:undecaprenyl-phosphate 4-deoxy-4-formamido-L-arabinose transferase